MFFFLNPLDPSRHPNPANYPDQAWKRVIYSRHGPINFLSEKSGDVIAIGLFRKPQDRLFSSFLDGWHHEGMENEEWWRIKVKLKESLHHFRMAKDTGNETLQTDMKIKLAEAYMQHDNMIGCYVKMLNGHHCVSGFLKRSDPFNQTALDHAIHILRQFYFVGIFEEYDKSISTLHRLANNGLTSPHQVLP